MLVRKPRKRVSRAPKDPKPLAVPLRIPQELINLIIDQLEDDFVALKSVGLVGRLWYPRTRQHLFKKLYIGEFGPPVCRLKDLREILRKRPGLVDRIQSLELANEVRGKGWIGGDQITSKDIEIILSQLTLKELLIDGQGDLHWNLMPKVLREALLRSLKQTTMRNLELEGVHGADVVEHVAKLSHLRKLSLHEVDVRTPAPALVTPIHPLADGEERLDSLTLSSSGTAIASLLGHAASPEGSRTFLFPRELVIDTLIWTDDMEAAFQLVLQVCAPTVEVYRLVQDSIQPLDEPTATPFPPSSLNLIPFTSLREFEFHITHGFIWHPAQNPIPLLIKALDALSQRGEPSTIRNLGITFDFRRVDGEDSDGDFDIRPSMRAFSREAFWVDLDKILARPAFANTQVTILFDVTYCKLSSFNWDQAEKQIRLRLKESCRARKIRYLGHYRQLLS